MSEVRYRTVDDFEGVKRRVRVVIHHGFEGYIVRWTETCTGCYEGGDYNGNSHLYPYDEKAQCSVGGGCHECGHTGKRRQQHFVAFDEPRFQRFLDARYERGERLLAFWRRKRGN